MAGHKGYVISFMMDMLAGVLTGSSFGAGVAGPYQPDTPSGCGHLLLTIDVAAMMAPEEFGDRMESLIAEVKAVKTAPGVEEIFFPGELEDRNSARNRGRGITLADNTWNSLSGLSADTNTDLPTLIDSGRRPAHDRFRRARADGRSPSPITCCPRAGTALVRLLWWRQVVRRVSRPRRDGHKSPC